MVIVEAMPGNVEFIMGLPYPSTDLKNHSPKKIQACNFLNYPSERFFCAGTILKNTAGLMVRDVSDVLTKVIYNDADLSGRGDKAEVK